MNPLEKLLNRKRKWTPVQTTKGRVKYGAEKPSSIVSQYATWNVQLARLYLIHSLRFQRKVKTFGIKHKDEDNHDLALRIYR